MSTINASELELAVAEAVARESGRHLGEIMPDSKLEDYEIDETAIAMISLNLETKLDVEIPDGLLSGLTTLKEVALRVSALIEAREASERKPGLWKAAQSFLFPRKASRVA